MKVRIGMIWAHVKSRPEGKGTAGHLMETELRPAWCSATVHLQICLAVEGGSHLAEVALLWTLPPGHLWIEQEGRPQHGSPSALT